MNAQRRIESAFESEGGKVMWKIALLVFGMFVSAMLALVQHDLGQFTQAADNNTRMNVAQDLDIALLKQEAAQRQRVSDSTVATLQALTQQVTQLSDSVQTLKEVNAERVRHSRPRQ
jgi:hypothetical protein